MEEIFIQFLWRHQHPLVKELRTTAGHPIQVHFPGTWNTGPGPDFLNAKVEWNGMKWAGHIEFHMKAKDWYSHGHHLDAQYNQVVLHIVLEGTPIRNAGIETVFLPKSEIEMLYKQWSNWRSEVRDLPCAPYHNQIREVLWFNWMTRMGVERLEQRCSEYQIMTIDGEFKWSSILFQKWFRSFGKGNWGDVLEQTASELNAVEFLHLEFDSQKAILFEVFGYSNLLSKEMRHWARRYVLLRKMTSQSHLKMKRKFGRAFNHDLLRFLISLKHFWNVLNNIRDFPALKLEKEVPAFVYINAIAPIQFFIGWKADNEEQMNAAIELLEKLPQEENARVKLFEKNGQFIKNAFQSQAAIHLFSVYCSRNQCLNCSIGAEILLKNESFRINQRCS
jgi:hypothetical protein